MILNEGLFSLVRKIAERTHMDRVWLSSFTHRNTNYRLGRYIIHKGIWYMGKRCRKTLYYITQDHQKYSDLNVSKVI